MTLVVRKPSARAASEYVPGVIRLRSWNVPAPAPDASLADSVTVLVAFVPSLAATVAPGIGCPDAVDDGAGDAAVALEEVEHDVGQLRRPARRARCAAG